MTRLREIKKYGNTFVIRLSISDMKDLSLKEGDFVDVEDVVKKKKPRVQTKTTKFQSKT